ncbi:hypothetical protein [Streptomyces xanthophaeus]|nr:hypothetical protein [Streptomyces xanthophaeus]
MQEQQSDAVVDAGRRLEIQVEARRRLFLLWRKPSPQGTWWPSADWR